MMDASEHQDSNSRKDNEDDDGRHDDDNQCGHTVAGKFFSWGGGRENFSNICFQVMILDIFGTQNKDWFLNINL